MARLYKNLGHCRECKKFDTFYFIDDRQLKMYCSICEPIVNQRKIDSALKILFEAKVTPEMFERLYKEVK